MAPKNIHAVPIIGEGQGVNLGGVFFPRGHEFGSVIYESKIHFFTFFWEGTLYDVGLNVWNEVMSLYNKCTDTLISIQIYTLGM